MVEINIDWLAETRNIKDDYGIDRGSNLVYHVRYDLPGLDFMDGHVHTIPIQAISDHMLTMNLPNPEDALEYCILDRVAMNYLDSQTPEEIKAGMRVSEDDEEHPLMEVKRTDDMKHRVWDGTNSTTAKVCANVQPSDPDTMLMQAYTMVDPCACADEGKEFILPELPEDVTPAVEAMMKDLRECQGECFGRCGNLVKNHSLNKSSPGWVDFCEVLRDRRPTIDDERFNIFDIRYGENLKKLAAKRCQGIEE